MKQTIGEIIKSMFVGPDNNPPTNVIDILKADHRKVEGLFKQFENAVSDEERKNLIDEIVKEISIHATLEEKLVYPELEGEGEKTKEALEEHHAVKLLIAELADMTGSDETAPAKVKVISEMVKHHIQEEELDLLPKLKSKAEDLEELGNQVLQEKELLLQNFKAPSRAEETMPETKRVDREKNSGVAPEDVLNFAPDAEENSVSESESESESDENTIVFEPDESRSSEPITIESPQVGGEQNLPELADTGSPSKSKDPRKHRATSLRKKGGGRKKAAHQPAKRASGGSKARSVERASKGGKSEKNSDEVPSSEEAKPTSKAKSRTNKTAAISKSTSGKLTTRSASQRSKKASEGKSKSTTKATTAKKSASAKAAQGSKKKSTIKAASSRKAASTSSASASGKGKTKSRATRKG